MRARHGLQDAVEERRRLSNRLLLHDAQSRRYGAGAMRATTPTRSSSAAILKSSRRVRPKLAKMLLARCSAFPTRRRRLRRCCATRAAVSRRKRRTSYPKASSRRSRLWRGSGSPSIALTLMACLATRSYLPLMLVGCPRVYGAWHQVLTGFTQHIGLADDVIDHRLNSRTMYINPLQPVRLLEHELSYRASHVPDGALPCAARAA